MSSKIWEKKAKLFEIADSQQGFFTAKQAQAAGFIATNHSYYVRTGAWIHEERGIYRLRDFPMPPRADLILYSLWSRDRNDRPQGVYSHETALTIYELSDLSPSQLSMTVPPTFRKTASTPKALKLYFEKFDPADTETMQGFRVTKPLRTIYDLIKAQESSEEFIEQALAQGVVRGLIPVRELRSEKIPQRIRKNALHLLSRTNTSRAAHL